MGHQHRVEMESGPHIWPQMSQNQSQLREGLVPLTLSEVCASNEAIKVLILPCLHANVLVLIHLLVLITIL